MGSRAGIRLCLFNETIHLPYEVDAQAATKGSSTYRPEFEESLRLAKSRQEELPLQFF